jgi:tetratricopeptide (TPR) repeat protein
MISKGLASIISSISQYMSLGGLSDQDLLKTKNVRKIKIRANELLQQGKSELTKSFYKKIIDLEPSDIESAYIYSQLIDDGTHQQMAKSRDFIISILNQRPDIFNADPHNINFIRRGALLSYWVGPIDKSIELFSKLVILSNAASDYYQLAEMLSHKNVIPESLKALGKAILLDPVNFDNETNRETLRLGGLNEDTENAGSKYSRNKIGRYPSTEDFQGDLQKLIQNHIANNLLNEEKFLDKKTHFFTMGSCFARNISKTLVDQGFNSKHMEISEFVNTTFANKAFVDYLANPSDTHGVYKRFQELLPDQLSAEDIIQSIRLADVFILTLGVSYAFFNRESGQFILPRPSSLNSRMLAEKYDYRCTSVSENVENVLYLIQYIRTLSPKIKIIVTVSPIPMTASFGQESCIQADCLSKSTMRLVADEIVHHSNIANILYWPSFEIFRWAGSQSSQYYAIDDGSSNHVSEDKVGSTIKAFIDIFKRPIS